MPSVDGALHLRRLDIVRDFHGVDEPSRVLEALAAAGMPTRTRRHHEYDHDGHLTYVLMGTTRRWKVRAYDKQHEVRDRVRRDPARRQELTPHLRERHQLRYEVSLFPQRLGELGLKTLADVRDPPQLLAVAEHYFRRCRLAETYGGASRVREVLAGSAGLTSAQARSILSTLAADTIGVALPYSKNEAAASRQRLRQYGLGAVTLTTAGAARRLDFPSGREVAADPTGR